MRSGLLSIIVLCLGFSHPSAAHSPQCDQKLTESQSLTLRSAFERFAGLIEASLPISSEETSEAGQKLIQSMNHTLLAGGKRLRPLLAASLAAQNGIPFEQIVSIIRGIEYLHTASLILDDLPAQDNASLRRGQPTNHIVFGEATAQLASVSLIAESFNELTKLYAFFPADRVVAVIQLWSQLLGREGLCLGQVIDLSPLDRVPLVRRYILKTGLGIEASLAPIAILAGWNEDDQKLLRNYAHGLGLLFQIQDDWMDRFVSSEESGKTSGLDAAQGREVLSELELRALLKKHHELVSLLARRLDERTKSQLWSEVVEFVVNRRK